MFEHRVRQRELMDDPSLSEVAHRRALRGLQRVNWISATARRLWRTMRPYADPQRGLRVLDVACGGGDVLYQLACHAHREKIGFCGVGCDISDTACRHAREFVRASPLATGKQTLEFIRRDCLHEELPAPFDVAVCSLFLHHLDAEDAVGLLRRLKEVSLRAVLVDDLVRSTSGYLLAWVGTRLLSRSPIVHFDGPLSVRAAFSVHEVSQLIEAAGLTAAKTTVHWPCRFLLHWSHP